MSLNVPPAAGVKPHEASQRLRVLIKALISNPALSAPGHAWKESGATQLATQAVMDRTKISQDSLLKMDSFLTDLVETSKLRKPSLISKMVEEARGGGVFYSLSRAIDRERMYRNDREKKVISQAVRLLSGSVPAAPSIAQEKLREIYSLIQVIPTIPNPTDDSKSERTLRAITAVLKAHFGQIEGTLAQIDQPELPIILLQSVEKIVEKYDQVVPPIVLSETDQTTEVDPSLVTEGKFEIWLTVGKFPEDSLHSPPLFPANALEKGSMENWNGGDCLLEDAIQALWQARGLSNGSRVTLRRDGSNLAFIRRGQPIEIGWLKAPRFELFTPSGAPLEESWLIGGGGSPSLIYGDPDHLGSITHWYKGACLFPEALEALRYARSKFSDVGAFELRREGEVYATASINVPAKILIGQHLIATEVTPF